jgi:uncharacterized delta-60 repeat protein
VQTDGTVLALDTDEAGTIYVGGAFNTPSRHFARILPTGAVDPLMHGSTSSRVDCLAIGGDGCTFGGPFVTLDGVPAVYTARITADGAVDRTFASSLGSTPSIEAGADAIALQPDGKVIVGGNFNTPDGFASLVRLNPDGSIDESFSRDHGPILYAKAIVLLANGQIVVGGIASSSGDGFVRRLNADGSVDQTFSAPTFDGCIETVEIDSDGSLFVGGSFSGGIARLNANGSVDADWNIQSDGVVKTLAIQDGEALIVGGAFNNIGNSVHRSLARINLRTANQTATNANGRFKARIQGEAGKTYEIQASEDLENWAALGTATATESGITIEEPTDSGRKIRFFRARLLN